MQKICNKDWVIFDYEVFQHWWCVVFQPIDGLTTIITSDSFDINKKAEIIFNSILVGFNIKNYDLKILSAIMGGYSPERLYQLSKNIVTEQEDVLNNIDFWNKYLFVDLFDDWRNGSLKEYESNKGLSIEESSVSFDQENLTEEEKESVIKYCVHDVEATRQLFFDREEYLLSKLELAKMFNISPLKALKCTNAKLCSIILNAQYVEREPETKYILPDRVKKYVYDNLPEDVIMAFSELNYEDKVFELFNNEVVFGIGGIHSTIGNNIATKSDDKYALVNVDVTSYYPNLIMHFGYMSRNARSPDVYEKIYHLRTQIKAEAKTELNTNGRSQKWYSLYYLQNGLKLILNTTYGATKNKYNALYDEYQASSLCYTGQLLLASLANNLFKSIPDLKIIQTNTDGILVKCLRTNLQQLESMVHEWENMCGFNMEFDYIDSFLQRDVNNYIENTGNTKDPYKLKGKWSNQAFKSDAESNLNAPIIHRAVLKYYVDNIPVETTINECFNIMDFCFTTKTGRTYDATYHMIDDKLVDTNKVNRVIATTNKSYGTIYKYKKDLEDPVKPNPFSEDYNKELKKYNAELKKRQAFEITYGLPFGRLDKAAEIPENATTLNGELPKWYYDIDTQWYINAANKKIKELINV